MARKSSGSLKQLVALDQGTTSSRAVIYSDMCEVVASASAEFPLYYPEPGWVEQDGEEIWASQLKSLESALSQKAVSSKDVAAIGITNQRETVLLWDRKTSKPVTRAIVWQDRRTATFCEELKRNGLEGSVRKKTGLPIDPYFSATKIRWLLDKTPNLRDRALKGELAFGTIDSWLLWKLTKGEVHATDSSNASRTLLFNIRTCEWDEELLHIFSVPRELLPEIRPAMGSFGECRIGPLKGVPIMAAVGDQQSALFGQRCFEPGLGKCTYGTGCFLLVNTGEIIVDSKTNLLSAVAWKTSDTTKYALEGGVFVGGAIIQWLRDGLKIISTSKEVEALARSVSDSAGVVFVPALTGLGAPHWDANARGGIIGLTRGSTAAHIARAAEEGIAFQVYDLVKCFEKEMGKALPSLRVDGGATEDELLLQIQADLLGIPVIRPANTEVTALGAAMLAGLGAGLWKSEKEIPANSLPDKSFEPLISRSEKEERLEKWQRAVQRVKAWET